MRISVFGLGYVGSVTAACLAKAGHDVIGVDVNPEKTAMVNEGKSPVIETGLSALVQEMVAARRLRATVSADWAVKHSDIAMICVGTPSGDNGQIDTTAIERVAQDIGRAIEHRTQLFTIVVSRGLVDVRIPPPRVLVPATMAAIRSRSAKETGRPVP